jgi:O-antigen/teichoic acid export membrane protein
MTLTKHIFSYSVVNIINSAVPFLLLPILTRYIAPEEYGVLSLIQMMFALALPFVLMNVHGLFTIEYSKLSFEEMGELISTMIWVPIGGFVVLQMIFFVGGDLIASFLHIPIKWVYFTPLVVLSQSIPAMLPVLFQAKKEPLNYGYFKVLLTVLNLGLSLLFVASFLQGYEGRLWGIFWSHLFFTLVGLVILYKINYLKLQVSYQKIKEALVFGVPLIPHVLAGVLLSMADRIFLSNMLGNEAVGIYSVAFQLASATAIIMASINQAWIPHLYEELNANPTLEAKRKIVIQSYKIMGIMFFVTVSFIGVVFFVYQIFINERYHSGINLARLLAIGFMFQGFYYMVTNYIFYMKKSTLLSLVTMSAAMVLMALNYILIPMYGIYGSAYAMIIGWLFLFVLIWNLAQKSYAMPWRRI